MKKSLHLYDSQTRSIVSIAPQGNAPLRIYTCGPTVYNFAHIGNFRTFLFEDILRRTCLLLGYEVCQVMNLTDVDDKTIKGAKEAKLSLDTFTAIYKKAFFEDLAALRIQKVEHYPEATQYIEQMILMIHTLISKNFAYKAKDGSVYFSISAFADYGKLCHLDRSCLKKGASGKNTGDDYGKDTVQDFVLWKAYETERDGDVFWQSPWGKGRPGWHIECSVMAKELLGDTIDIHAGGVDLIFPHHENEIAQSEASSGKPFARHWAHAEHLMVDGKKMSKSLGNFYTLRDLLEQGYAKTAIRFHLLSTHYRMPMNFTLQGLDAAFASVKRIRDTFTRLQEWTPHQHADNKAWILYAQEQFEDAMSNDLAIAQALAIIFDFVKEINQRLDTGSLSFEETSAALAAFATFDAILDILQPEETSLPQEVEAFMSLRVQARKEKNWALSDELRDKIKALGYAIEDTPKGQKVTHMQKKEYGN